jgi:hypothetical protein
VPGLGKKSRSRSGIRDEHPRLYFRELRKQFLGLKILKFFEADPDPGSGIILTLDPGYTSRKHNTGQIPHTFFYSSKIPHNENSLIKKDCLKFVANLKAPRLS